MLYLRSKFIRRIAEYNSFRKRLMTDFLASFTYIPGTVVHFGYGSLYEKIEWRNGEYVSSNRFLETKRGLFFKASFLWRLKETITLNSDLRQSFRAIDNSSFLK